MPRKARQLAVRSALSEKLRANELVVLDAVNFEAPKTKQYAAMLKNLGAQEQKTLLVLPEVNKNISTSGRNIQNTKVITASQLNTYDVIHADKVILVESSVGKIDSLLK